MQTKQPTHPTFLRLLALVKPLGKNPKDARDMKTYLERIGGLKELRSRQAATKRQKVFRRNYLAALRRREAKANKHDATTLLGQLAWFDRRDQYDNGTWGTRIDTVAKELAECQRLRENVTGKKQPPKEVAKLDPILVPVTVKSARKAGASINMAGKDACLKRTWKHSYGEHSEGVTHWKGGRPKSYDRATHNNYVRSIAVMANPTTLDYCLHETIVQVVLPIGYHWDRDTNGLKAVADNSPADDYHVNADDLMSRKAGQEIVAKLQQLRERRLETEARQAAEKADIEGILVCYADARKAGNCEAGTKSFAFRHGLDIRQHYPATQLLGMANGDYGRVRLAITAAVLRTKKENERGYALFSDHFIANEMAN